MMGAMPDPLHDDLFRHIAACRNAVLPGERLPFLLGPHRVGWLLPELAERMAASGALQANGEVVLPNPAALEPLARSLADAGAFRWRNEAFDVRTAPDGPVLARLDRGALPAFGILSRGVHLNGIVRRPDGPWLWVGRRAKDKQMDPGKLDQLVAGGVPAGYTLDETLRKEAEEEAALPAALIQHARPGIAISYAMLRPEGLRRDWLRCYDLELPDTFMPRPVDGEVEAFELWPLPAVLDRVRRTDDFKFNVNLVLIDLFLRRGMIEAEEALLLRQALDGSRSDGITRSE